jgi:diamine N-acetyltransferase
MLKGKNISLRPIEPSDVDLLYSWENDPENWEVSQNLIPFSHQSLSEYALAEHDLVRDGQFRFMICDQEMRPVGTLDLFQLNAMHSRCGIGILIANKDDRRKSYALDALQTAIEYGWHTLNLRQWWCTILKSNKASVSLFEKLEFERCGVKIDWINSGGEWLDLFDYQLMRK